MSIPRFESYVLTLGLSFQTIMTISSNPGSISSFQSPKVTIIVNSKQMNMMNKDNREFKGEFKGENRLDIKNERGVGRYLGLPSTVSRKRPDKKKP